MKGYIIINFMVTYLLLSLLRCVSPIVTIATVLTNDSEMFQGGLSFKEAIRTVKKTFHPCSDHLALAWLYHEWELLHDEGEAEALRFSQSKGMNNVNMKLISSKNKIPAIALNTAYNGFLMTVLPFQTGFYITYGISKCSTIFVQCVCDPNHMAQLWSSAHSVFFLLFFPTFQYSEDFWLVIELNYFQFVTEMLVFRRHCVQQLLCE